MHLQEEDVDASQHKNLPETQVTLICIIIAVCNNNVVLYKQEIQTATTGEITLSSQNHETQREKRKRNKVVIHTRSIFFWFIP